MLYVLSNFYIPSELNPPDDLTRNVPLGSGPGPPSWAYQVGPPGVGESFVSDAISLGPPTALDPRRSFCRGEDPCVGGECTSCQRCPPPPGLQPSRADCFVDEGSDRCASTYSESWPATPRESSRAHLRAAEHSFYPPPGLALPDDVDAAPKRQRARVEPARGELPSACAPPPTPSSASDRRSVKSP